MDTPNITREQFLTKRLDERSTVLGDLTRAADRLIDSASGNGSSITVSKNALNALIDASREAKQI